MLTITNKIKVLKHKMKSVDDMITKREELVQAAWKDGRFKHYHKHRYMKMELQELYETLYEELEALQRR